MDKTVKERMKRYREKKRNEAVTETRQDVTVSVTERMKSVTPDVTAYHPVLKWLIPGERRDKLEKIVTSQKRHNQLENVYLGCGRNSLPLSIVSEMLEATS